MIITLKGANFSTNNINDLLNSYSISYAGSGVIGTPSSRLKDAVGDLTCALTILDGYTYKSLTVSIGGAVVDATQYDITVRDSVVRVIIAESVINGNIAINVVTEGGSVVDPDIPTNYTITYKYMSDNTEIKTATTETVTAGSSKTFSTSNAPTIDGYTVSSVIPDGEQDINSNLIVTYYYTANAGGGETAEIDISSLFTSTWREGGGAIIVDSTKTNYGWHQANQTAYRCSGSYVDVTKYTTYFDGKNVKLQITLPRATNSSHVQYGLAFYSNTTVSSTGVADVILGTCPMQYKATDYNNPSVETREITIPAGTKYIKTTWLTAANETTLGAVFSAKIIPN